MTAIGEFLHWWRGQLLELVPDSLRSMRLDNSTTLTIAIERDQAVYSSTATQQVAEVDVDLSEEPRPSAELTAFLNSMRGTPQRIELKFRAGQYLSQELTLPAAAKQHLAETISYQLPKLTPFSADQALYACGPKDTQSSDDSMRAWLVVVPRQKVARALTLIGHTPPDNPLPLKSPPSPGQALELGWRVSGESSSSGLRMRLVWIALLFAWLGAFALHLNNRQDAREVLQAKLDDIRGEAAEVSEMRERLDAMTAQLDWIGDRKQNTPSALGLLDSLTRLLDDGSSLQRLYFDGESATLNGISSAPSSLVETLEGSDAFEGVSFDAFTRDVRSQSDRFNISVKISPPQTGGDE